ncbi:tyrosine-type recombinase/integrase [Rhodopseudomonas sp. HC1]|uniref:tyrosine-type recombinase/integrase n=1 Tax=Rhodopseudomonas infernalis TaxID=2897386 RepID=UPI001EE8A01D|nr:tyrosine-type recombinase/integrase [Rhodopseudomonas infernalis]MCG6205825.1 tyrosine-type recombinase/integrase [Rhodopseudomonas infernalis]
MPQLPVSVLPPYLRLHQGRDNELYFRFEVPTRDRKAGFEPCCVPLGTDVKVAIRRVENELLPRLYAFREGGRAIMIPQGPVPGTIDELIQVYTTDPSGTFLNNNSERGQKKIRYYLSRGADHIFREGPYAGRRFGSLPIDKLTAADGRRFRIEFEKVEERSDDTGEKEIRKRPRSAQLTFEAFKSMLFSTKGVHELVPSENPFAKLKFARHYTEEIYAATLEDLLRIIFAAEQMKCSSIATMCLVAYDLQIRVESIGGRLLVEHYKPADRPDQMLITHWKTKHKRWIHLHDRDGNPLYGALEARLDQCKGDRTSGILIPRDGTTDKPWGGRDESLSNTFYTKYHQVAAAAGLVADCKFTSFRHGGITESAEAGCTEPEVMILSGHLHPNTAHRYIKKTRSRREKARLKVVANRDAELARMRPSNLPREMISKPSDRNDTA